MVTQPLSDTDIIAHALSTYSSAHHQVNEFLVGIFDAWRLRTTLPPSVLAQAEALTRTTRGGDGVITHDDRVGVVVGLALTEIRAQTGYSNLANAIVTGVAPSFLASDNIPLIAQASDAELILSGMANAWQRYQNECVARGRTSWGETHFMYQLDRPGAAAPRVVRRVPVLAPGNSMQGGGFKEQTGSCLWEFKGRSSHFLISIARSSTDGKPRVYWNNSGAVVSPKSDLFDSIYPRWVDKMGQRGLDTFHEIHMDGTVPTSDILRRFEVDCS